MDDLRGPFGFAQGKLLKRRSSTSLHAFVDPAGRRRYVALTVRFSG
ncbi:MAG: hypothetical protein WBQ85_20815 [Candidatus Sulfotelmatobacter sp.]